MPARHLAVVAAAALALTTATACTSSSHHSTKTSSSTADNPVVDELKKTLLPASAISSAIAADNPADKFTLTNTTPVSQSGAVGISGVYGNSDHKRVVSIILIHFPTAAYAQEGLQPTQSAAAVELTHNPASDTPVTLGQGDAHLYQGSNDTGPLSIIVFAEGHYIVTMEFVSKTKGDDVPAKVVTDLAKAQDAKIIAAH